MKNIAFTVLLVSLLPVTVYAQMYGQYNNNQGMYSHQQPSYPAPIYMPPNQNQYQQPSVEYNNPNEYQKNYINSLPTQRICTMAGNAMLRN